MMSTKTAKACLYPAIGAMAALALCPAAQAQPERQCYLTTAGSVVCVNLSNNYSDEPRLLSNSDGTPVLYSHHAS